MSISYVIEGFFLGLGLLVALGPKDTFVIRNSLAGKNFLLLVAICALSDALLIFLGVFGLGYVITSNKLFMTVTMVASIAYLVYFGVESSLSIFRKANYTINTKDSRHEHSQVKIIKGALFHSLLTPYAWLDTVLVIGSLSASKIGEDKYAFAGGAILASFSWFIFLTLGTSLVAPIFNSRRTWQLIDFIVATSMFILSAKLMQDYPWHYS